MVRLLMINILIITSVTVCFCGDLDDSLRILRVQKELSHVELNIKKLDDSIISLKQIFNDSVYLFRENISIIKQKLVYQDSLINEQKKLYLNLKNKNELQLLVSIKGAIILLLGLFLEIIGATFLSSENLTKPNDKIRPYVTEYGILEIGSNKNLNNKIISFQVIGTLLLMLGFSMQFIGTLLVISNNWVINWIIIIFSVVFIFLITTFISRKVGGIKLYHKVKESLLNIKGIILYSIEHWFHKKEKVICETCFKIISAKRAYIVFLKSIKNDSKEPRKIIIGHEKCINAEFEINRLHSDSNFEIVLTPLYEFINKGEFDKFLTKKEEYSNKYPNSITEFTDAMDRIKKIKERLHFR